MSESIVLKGGTVVNRDAMFIADVMIKDGCIIQVGDNLTAERIVDVQGKYVSSGFVDLHTHLREPGKEEAETIETGSRAAALGGYTAVVAMPNTDPTQDNVETIRFVAAQGKRAGLCEVKPSGSITIGRLGKRLVPFELLAHEGVTLFTDDGNGVQDVMLMRRALFMAHQIGVTLAQHCEVASLTSRAVMHEGSCCSHMGVPGWPAEAEEAMVRRDLDLVRETGASMHFLHLSTAGSVELIRAAKKEGLPITAEVTPHHISLRDEMLLGFNPLFKVNPPLRTEQDIDALHEGVRDGTVDAIATDHAPHAAHTKEMPLDEAPPGMLGLETALGVLCTALPLDVQRIVELMSWNPARIACLHDRHGRNIAAGEPANIAIWDTTTTWKVSQHHLASLSRNTPFDGMTLRGKVHHTIFDGEIVVYEGKAQK
jgi:dihydroorotase